MGEERARLDWPAIRIAVADLWRDYHWPVKLVLALVVLSCIWGAAIAGWPEIAEAAPPWLRMVGSDGVRTLLTFVIALLIAVNFYMRARRGVLDGDEHYNVARALAFGYFKNFLVPALQLALRNGRSLYVLRPTSMDDLRAYSRDLEPRLRSLFDHEWLPIVDLPAPGGPPRRTVLALQSPRRESIGEEEPFFFDAPTALFTVSDFYDALNRRLHDDGKEPLGPDTVLRYQNGQIASFFTHLDFLFTEEAGFSAVSDIVGAPSDLGLLRARLRLVTVADLDARYPVGD